jgi:hypothetical protein
LAKRCAQLRHRGDRLVDPRRGALVQLAGGHQPQEVLGRLVDARRESSAHLRLEHLRRAHHHDALARVASDSARITSRACGVRLVRYGPALVAPVSLRDHHELVGPLVDGQVRIRLEAARDRVRSPLRIPRRWPATSTRPATRVARVVRRSRSSRPISKNARSTSARITMDAAQLRRLELGLLGVRLLAAGRAAV